MTNETALAPAPLAPTIPRRLEGRDKLLGRARYAGDFTGEQLPGGVLDTAVAVTSTQASGQVTAIDAGAARLVPGVRLVLTHENAPRLHSVLATNGAARHRPAPDLAAHHPRQAAGRSAPALACAPARGPVAAARRPAWPGGLGRPQPGRSRSKLPT